jgi:hypothetical protein
LRPEIEDDDLFKHRRSFFVLKILASEKCFHIRPILLQRREMPDKIRRWVALHPNWTLTLATRAALLPFLAKPFNIDDPLFIWTAHQIQSHPANPYGFNEFSLGCGGFARKICQYGGIALQVAHETSAMQLCCEGGVLAD